MLHFAAVTAAASAPPYRADHAAAPPAGQEACPTLRLHRKQPAFGFGQLALLRGLLLFHSVVVCGRRVGSHLVELDHGVGRELLVMPEIDGVPDQMLAAIHFRLHLGVERQQECLVTDLGVVVVELLENPLHRKARGTSPCILMRTTWLVSLSMKISPW